VTVKQNSLQTGFRTAFLLFCVCGSVLSLSGQVPSPTPDSSDVVKISTSLIQLDVTVTDKRGKVVTDLRPGEIEVYENGEKQKVTAQTFVSSVRTRSEQPKTADPLAPKVPPSVLRPENIRRTIALVVDDLSLSFESVYYARRALKKFVDEQMEDGDLVAIIRVGAGIGALQQFTSDKRLLYAAIEKVKYNMTGTGQIGAFAPVTGTEEATPDASDDEIAPAGPSLEDFRTSFFATGTLGALRYVVSGMDELPGRKSVILFSQGFRLFETDGNGFQSTGTVMGFLRQLIETANRASVVFYAVDPRGLPYTGLTAADSPSSAQQAASVMSARTAELNDTQDGLRFLARETGGFAAVNSNDLSGNVKRILEDQSYYLVAYEPDTDTFDAAKRRFNKIQIKVTRPGLNVRYRSGFFNVADRPQNRVSTALSPLAQLQTALTSPFALNEIDLHLNALYGNDPKTGTFVRSLLHIDASDIKFTEEADGTKQAVFQVLAMSFGDNGQVVDQLGKAYTLNVKGQTYAKMMKEGFNYQFLFPVRKAGAYQYRVAVRDQQGGKLGSANQFIEVPDFKKRLNLSSIVLESLTAEQWKATTAGNSDVRTDPVTDTALRRIRAGTVLRYGMEIYKPKLGPDKLPRLEMRTRVFKDGKLVLDGNPTPVDTGGQTDMMRVKSSRALALGDQMTPGDYILQLVVIDTLAKGKERVATQSIQFELVN
jgi:VWFA-related protein